MRSHGKSLENRQVADVHAEELIYTYFQQLDESRIPDLARRMADAGTYLTTTVSPSTPSSWLSIRSPSCGPSGPPETSSQRVDSSNTDRHT